MTEKGRGWPLLIFLLAVAAGVAIVLPERVAAAYYYLAWLWQTVGSGVAAVIQSLGR